MAHSFPSISWASPHCSLSYCEVQTQRNIRESWSKHWRIWEVFFYLVKRLLTIVVPFFLSLRNMGSQIIVSLEMKRLMYWSLPNSYLLFVLGWSHSHDCFDLGGINFNTSWANDPRAFLKWRRMHICLGSISYWTFIAFRKMDWELRCGQAYLLIWRSSTYTSTSLCIMSWRSVVAVRW